MFIIIYYTDILSVDLVRLKGKGRGSADSSESGSDYAGSNAYFNDDL